MSFLLFSLVLSSITLMSLSAYGCKTTSQPYEEDHSEFMNANRGSGLSSLKFIKAEGTTDEFEFSLCDPTQGQCTNPFATTDNTPVRFKLTPLALSEAATAALDTRMTRRNSAWETRRNTQRKNIFSRFFSRFGFGKDSSSGNGSEDSNLNRIIPIPYETKVRTTTHQVILGVGDVEIRETLKIHPDKPITGAVVAPSPSASKETASYLGIILSETDPQSSTPPAPPPIPSEGSAQTPESVTDAADQQHQPGEAQAAKDDSGQNAQDSLKVLSPETQVPVHEVSEETLRSISESLDVVIKTTDIEVSEEDSTLKIADEVANYINIQTQKEGASTGPITTRRERLNAVSILCAPKAPAVVREAKQCAPLGEPHPADAGSAPEEMQPKIPPLQPQGEGQCAIDSTPSPFQDSHDRGLTVWEGYVNCLFYLGGDNCEGKYKCRVSIDSYDNCMKWGDLLNDKKKALGLPEISWLPFWMLDRLCKSYSSQ